MIEIPKTLKNSRLGEVPYSFGSSLDFYGRCFFQNEFIGPSLLVLGWLSDNVSPVKGEIVTFKHGDNNEVTTLNHMDSLEVQDY